MYPREGDNSSWATKPATHLSPSCVAAEDLVIYFSGVGGGGDGDGNGGLGGGGGGLDGDSGGGGKGGDLLQTAAFKPIEIARELGKIVCEDCLGRVGGDLRQRHIAHVTSEATEGGDASHFVKVQKSGWRSFCRVETPLEWHRRPLLARVTLAPRAAVSLLRGKTDDDMKRVFTSFDKDGDGMIHTVELRTMMTQLGQRPTDVLGEKNVDGSGAINFLEWASVLQRQAKRRRRLRRCSRVKVQQGQKLVVRGVNLWPRNRDSGTDALNRHDACKRVHGHHFCTIGLSSGSHLSPSPRPTTKLLATSEPSAASPMPPCCSSRSSPSKSSSGLATPRPGSSTCTLPTPRPERCDHSRLTYLLYRLRAHVRAPCPSSSTSDSLN